MSQPDVLVIPMSESPPSNEHNVKASWSLLVSSRVSVARNALVPTFDTVLMSEPNGVVVSAPETRRYHTVPSERFGGSIRTDDPSVPSAIR